MPAMRGLLAPQNTFLDTIATRFDGTRESGPSSLASGEKSTVRTATCCLSPPAYPSSPLLKLGAVLSSQAAEVSRRFSGSALLAGVPRCGVPDESS